MFRHIHKRLVGSRPSTLNLANVGLRRKTIRRTNNLFKQRRLLSLTPSRILRIHNTMPIPNRRILNTNRHNRTTQRSLLRLIRIFHTTPNITNSNLSTNSIILSPVLRLLRRRISILNRFNQRPHNLTHPQSNTYISPRRHHHNRHRRRQRHPRRSHNRIIQKANRTQHLNRNRLPITPHSVRPSRSLPQIRSTTLSPILRR